MKLTSCGHRALTDPSHPHRPSTRPHVLLGVTGSVAAIKVPELATKLLHFADVRIVATPSARHFFTQEQLPAECGPLLGVSL
jgi:phosphopantothenoylcysteine synthetase/decarboxylase